MVGLAERLQFVLSLDADGAIRGFRNVGDSADRNLGRAEDRLDRMSAQSFRLGAGFAGAAAVGGRALFELGERASALEQAVGGTNQIFGEAAEGVGAFAQSAADAAGLSERAARELTTEVGAVLQAFGATQEEAAAQAIRLTQLGADAAATFGGTAEEAVRAYGAAIRGETEAARRFGVVIEGGAKGADAFAQIVDQASAFAGQFGREAETAAGAQAIAAAEAENLAASIGGAVAPAMASAFGATSDFIGGVQRLNEQTGGAVGELGALAVGASGLAGSLLLVNGAALRARGALTALGSVNPAVVALTAAVAVGAAAFTDYSRDAEQVERRLEDMVTSIRSAESAVAGLGNVVARTTDDNDNFRAALLAAGLTVDDVTDAIDDGANGALRSLADQLRAGAEAAGLSQREIVLLLGELQALGREYEQANQQIAEYEQATADAADATDDEADAVRSLGNFLPQLTAAQEDAARAAEERADAERDAVRATIAGIDAGLAYEDSLRETSEALADVATQQAAAEASASPENIQALTDARFEAAEAAVAQAAAAAEAAGAEEGSAEAAAIQAAELRKVADTLGPASPLARRLNGYAAELEAIAGTVSTVIELDTSQADRDLDRLRRDLEGLGRITIAPAVSGSLATEIGRRVR